MSQEICDVPITNETMEQLHLESPQMYEGMKLLLEQQRPIIDAWVHQQEVQEVLLLHGIDPDSFKGKYACEVFNYFVGVIAGVYRVGDCPVMVTFLEYLKDRNVTMDELYTICTYFRKAMLDRLCDSSVDVRHLFGQISYVFDRNFAGVLKVYAERLQEKEQELAKNIGLLNAYKNAIDESTIVSKTDGHGIITYVNDRFVEVCGFAREELLGFSHNITRHPEMPASFFKELWQTILHRQVFRGTMRNKKKNGESYYMDLTIVPMYDPVNEVMEYMGIGYDVTRLVEARKEAEMAGQAKEYFLSNMSHEIRTPLNAILGFVSLLIDENHDRKHQKYLDIIYNSGENLLGIINDILDFSKIRSGEFTVVPRPFNVHDELTYTLELFAPAANEKKVTIFSFIDPSIPAELVADPLRVKQIVANLLSNAVKFTPFGGYIDIIAGYEKGVLEISVYDNGPGVPPADQEKIFNAFSQGEANYTRQQGGTGLGLSICKKLAEHMGGTILLESAVGSGSCFTLQLEATTTECPVGRQFDTELFRDLKMCILAGNRRRPEITSLLTRYWEVFEFDVSEVMAFEAGACDLLFFVDSEITETQRQAIIASGSPAIAIMEYISDRYDAVENVTALYFPIYCMKLYNAMGEALGFTDDSATESDTQAISRRFEGRVLVAEDNVANRELIRIILEKYGIEATIVENGEEAVEQFDPGAFDLILMDEQMPRMNGKEAMHRIRKETGSSVPIVAVTANVVNEARERGIRSGYDAFVGKPINVAELEEVLERYLDEKTPYETLPAVPDEAGRRVRGLDMEKLRKELMLDDAEILLLLEVFLGKVRRLMLEMGEAVDRSDYERIASTAHSVKGSSANFRLKRVQDLAKKMEDAASKKEKGFDYEAYSRAIGDELATIGIEP